VNTSLGRGTGSDLYAEVLPDQNQMYTLAAAHALVTIPADSPGYLRDEEADVIILDRAF